MKQGRVLLYREEIEREIRKVQEVLKRDEVLVSRYNLRWLAIKLLEADEDVKERVKPSPIRDEIFRVVNECRKRLSEKYGDPEVLLAEERYRVIGEIVKKVVKGVKEVTLTDLLDRVFLDKWLGIPVFLVLLWVMFRFTMSISEPLCNLIGDFFSWLSSRLAGLTGNPVVDSLFFGEYGVLNGIGTVLSFVPIIFALFFSLSILEDSGYMARAAFIMDRVMRKFALTGRTIISMILGFGCNVPAIYSTRAIPDEKDRLTAIMINPLMLCSARLTALSLMAYAFFGGMAGDAIFSLYAIGIGLAILMALFIRKVVFKGVKSPFILEMPPYQVPTLRTVLIHMWERGVLFVKKAGTVILLGLIVVGILSHLQWGSWTWGEDVANSVVGVLGRVLQPVFSPLGWDWRLAVAAFFGFVAKEIVIGSMAMLYGVSEEGLVEKLSSTYPPVVGYAYMVFVLIYVPCVVTLAAIKHETGSWKWMFFTVAYELILAYLASLVVIMAGRLMGFV